MRIAHIAFLSTWISLYFSPFYMNIIELFTFLNEYHWIVHLSKWISLNCHFSMWRSLYCSPLYRKMIVLLTSLLEDDCIAYNLTGQRHKIIDFCFSRQNCWSGPLINRPERLSDLVFFSRISLFFCSQRLCRDRAGGVVDYAERAHIFRKYLRGIEIFFNKLF